MIELAPSNINGLQVRAPVLLAPGCADTLRWADADNVGAVATDVAVAHTPRGGPGRWGTTPAGVVFERLPSVRFDALLRAERTRWARSSLPVLLTLRGTADDVIDMARRLETIEGVAGLVLLLHELMLSEAIALVRAATTLPLLPVLPHGPQLSELACGVAAAGADALVLCGYPPAAAPSNDELITGLLVGPALAPWTLRAVQQVHKAVDVPLVAWGGIVDPAIAHQCLAAGAGAVMVDGALYGEPFAARRIAAAIGI
jgi:dihydroorotate dehydrogenase